MSERLIQEWIEEERARCRGLVEKLIAEPDFLMYCIDAPIHPGEDLDHHRRRFAEYQPVVADEFEDLM
jgi:hypothetical protein